MELQIGAPTAIPRTVNTDMRTITSWLVLNIFDSEDSAASIADEAKAVQKTRLKRKPLDSTRLPVGQLCGCSGSFHPFQVTRSEGGECVCWFMSEAGVTGGLGKVNPPKIPATDPSKLGLGSVCSFAEGVVR